jgi:hypothetical protein
LSHRYCYLPLSWKSWNRFECAVGGVRHPQHTQTSSNSSRGDLKDTRSSAAQYMTSAVFWDVIQRRSHNLVWYILFDIRRTIFCVPTDNGKRPLKFKWDSVISKTHSSIPFSPPFIQSRDSPTSFLTLIYATRKRWI